MKILKRILGTRNQRAIRGYMKAVSKINAQEDHLTSLSDDQLRQKTKEFKERLASGESLDDILVEAFAVVREASRRAIGLRHFDVQCVGGMVLHYGKVAEMRTGEGKTLVATLPAYLNALKGMGVHIITVNDYLAQRDADKKSELFDLLRPLEGDCTLRLLTFDDDIGKMVFWHSSAHILGQAIERQFGGHLTIGPPIQGGFYYDTYCGTEVCTEEKWYPKLEKEIKKIVSEKQSFERLVVTKEEALEMFDHNVFKREIFRTKEIPIS